MIAFLLAAAAALSTPPHGGERIEPERLMADVAVLAGDAMEGRGTGTEGAARARRYIAARFREIGLRARQQRFTFVSRGAGPRQGVNLVVRVRGTARGPRGAIVVTAHYDHDGIRGGQVYNGADDNASGIAALLEIAASLKGAPPAHDVLLVALDAEEPLPGMFGARAFLADPPISLERLLLNVNLDMVSRGDTGTLWAAGTGRHPALCPVLDAVAAAAPVRLAQGHDSGEGGEDWTLLSDHGPFHEAGIPFVYFGVDEHPDYHRPTDDAERIDRIFFARSTETILAAIRAFDAAPEALRAARAEAAAPR